MAKISNAGGPTDATQPGYEELGQSEQSPKVIGNAEHPTEADYNDAMARHGTEDFTEADAELTERYRADRKAAEAEKAKAEKPEPKSTKPAGTTQNGTTSARGK